MLRFVYHRFKAKLPDPLSQVKTTYDGSALPIFLVGKICKNVMRIISIETDGNGGKSQVLFYIISVLDVLFTPTLQKSRVP